MKIVYPASPQVKIAVLRQWCASSSAKSMA
jgi:hypothetical protein